MSGRKKASPVSSRFTTEALLPFLSKREQRQASAALGGPMWRARQQNDFIIVAITSTNRFGLGAAKRNRSVDGHDAGVGLRIAARRAWRSYYSGALGEVDTNLDNDITFLGTCFKAIQAAEEEKKNKKKGESAK